MNAATKPEAHAISLKPASQVDLSPQTFEQALTFSNYLADSDMVPKDFKGKPGNCLIAMQWGAEVGLKPLQALQNIAVINGRPSLWGDSVIALVRSSPLCEYVLEEFDTKGTAICKVKRRGEPEQIRTFSDQDAQVAGLLNKQGPWTTNPKRMKQMRARAFALRDVFPDVLKGMPVAEEIMDIPVDMGPAVIVSDWPADVLQRGTEAAAKGSKEYGAFWKAMDAALRDKLVKTTQHQTFKETALAADAARTVDTPPAAAAAPTTPAAKTFDEVMAMICAASNIDALFVAGDWINSIQNPDEVAILNAKFDEIKAKLEGGAK